ncbi:MAG: FAD:protein FMN transferase [Actinobacteria bacterium]|nr:FAD:protein FMN transferase [Actinomycetota bacterium]
MGTECHVIVEGGSRRLLDLAQTEIERLELLWSRFLEDSELSRLNRRGALVVSQETADLLARSAWGQGLTHGLFDPFLEREIVAQGYSRDFADLEEAGASAGAGEVSRAGSSRGRLSVLAAARREGRTYLNRRTGLAQLPRGYRLDSGGLGKGLAADRVARSLMGAGAAAALVNLGGDLRTMGHPSRGMWQIGIADESEVGDQVLSVNLASGGLATSSVTRRRWRVAGADRHHLLNPRTGRPAHARIAAATAIAEAGWLAEVMAKAALLGEAADAAQLVVRRNGAILERRWDGGVDQHLHMAPQG